MAGQSFRSKLNPHFEMIRAARLREETWEEIARRITVAGTPTDRSQVCKFFQRRMKGKTPLGFAPAPVQSGSPPPASIEGSNPAAEDLSFSPRPKLTLKVIRSSQDHEQDTRTTEG